MEQLMTKRLLTALFYAIASFLIVVVNKTILTTYKFPSFQVLAVGQMLATIVFLFLGKQLRIIDFPGFSPDIIRKIWPLPLLYVGNLVFGLGGTKRLSLPMFTVLRRFSILMTMIGEKLLLSVTASIPVQLSVYSMIFGSMIAALNDFAFDAIGYSYVLINDFFTAANGVYVKKKLDSKDLGKYGLMYYNSLFMLPFTAIYCWFYGEFDKAAEFKDWLDLGFLTQFCASCIMGFVLMYSIMLCTQYNSALTTTIIGCLKNVIITYIGMFIGGDYIFSVYNFVGLNISILGSVVYSVITFREKTYKPLEPVKSEPI